MPRTFLRQEKEDQLSPLWPDILPGLSVKAGASTVPYFHPGPDILSALSIKAGTILSSKPDNLLGLSIKAGAVLSSRAEYSARIVYQSRYRTFIQTG